MDVLQRRDWEDSATIVRNTCLPDSRDGSEFKAEVWAHVRLVLVKFAAICVVSALACSLRAQHADYVRNADATALVEDVRQAFRSSGANADRGNVDIVIALMTSHFGADPSHAEGMRRIATDFIKRFSAVGDRVVVAAWEMEVWLTSQPKTLADTCAPKRAEVVQRMLPTAQRTQSRGGHDTERAMVGVWQEIARHGRPDQAVLVLLATEEASMLPPGAKGDKLLGLNSPEYQALMSQVRRRPPVRLEFEARPTPTSKIWKPRTATAIVVLPESPAVRPASVRRGEDKTCQSRPDWVRILIWAIIVLALAAMLVLGYRALIAGRSLRGAFRSLSTAAIGDRNFSLEGAETVEWRLFGMGATADGANDVVVDSISGDAPPTLIGKLIFNRGQGLVLRPESFVTRVVVDGAVSPREAIIVPGDHTIELQGKYRADAESLEDKFTVRFKTSIK